MGLWNSRFENDVAHRKAELNTAVQSQERVTTYPPQELYNVTDVIEPYNDVTLLLALYPELEWRPDLASNPNISWQKYLQSNRNLDPWTLRDGHVDTQRSMTANPNTPEPIIHYIASTPDKFYISSNPRLTLVDAANILEGQNSAWTVSSILQQILSNPAFNMVDIRALMERFNLQRFYDKPLDDLGDSMVAPGFARGIGDNPNITADFIEKYPNIKYDRYFLAKNPGLNYDDIKRLNLYHYSLIKNPNVYNTFIKGHDADWQHLIDNPTPELIELHNRVKAYSESNKDITLGGVYYSYPDLKDFIQAGLFANSPLDMNYLSKFFRELEEKVKGWGLSLFDFIGTLQKNPHWRYDHVYNLIQDAINRGVNVYEDKDSGRAYYELPYLIAQNLKTVRPYRTPIAFNDLANVGLREYYNYLLEKGYDPEEYISQILNHIEPIEA